MTHTNRYRTISGARDEGPDHGRMLHRVGHFWQKVMHAQVVRDAPGVLVKHARDWEYPWAMLKSQPAAGKRMLDCGAGFSPVPFLWSQEGAEAHAIDRDALLCSRLVYPLHVLGHVVMSLLRLPGVICRRLTRTGPVPTALVPAMQHASKPDSGPPAGPLGRAMRFVWSGMRNRWPMVRRIWRPDTWGPVSPRLRRKYNLDYRRGDLTDLPFADGYFDAVTCISVLEHMPVDAQQHGMREMARVTRPGGRLIITYDQYDQDLTDRFVELSGMTPDELVYLRRPDDMLDKTLPDIVGLCLIKPRK